MEEGPLQAVRITFWCTLLALLTLQSVGASPSEWELQLGAGFAVNVWVQGEPGALLLPASVPPAAPGPQTIELTLLDANGKEMWSFRGEAADRRIVLREPDRFGPCTLTGTFPGPGPLFTG